MFHHDVSVMHQPNVRNIVEPNTTKVPIMLHQQALNNLYGYNEGSSPLSLSGLPSQEARGQSSARRNDGETGRKNELALNLSYALLRMEVCLKSSSYWNLYSVA
jgi:hypothetical protein